MNALRKKRRKETAKDRLTSIRLGLYEAFHTDGAR